MQEGPGRTASDDTVIHCQDFLIERNSMLGWIKSSNATVLGRYVKSTGSPFPHHGD